MYAVIDIGKLKFICTINETISSLFIRTLYNSQHVTNGSVKRAMKYATFNFTRYLHIKLSNRVQNKTLTTISSHSACRFNENIRIEIAQRNIRCTIYIIYNIMGDPTMILKVYIIWYLFFLTAAYAYNINSYSQSCKVQGLLANTWLEVSVLDYCELRSKSSLPLREYFAKAIAAVLFGV